MGDAFSRRAPSNSVLVDTAPRNAFQPDLTPVGIDCPRTKAAANCITRFADDILEHDCIGLEPEHLASLLIDDLLHRAIYLVFAPGKWDHFRIKIQSAIPIIAVQCFQDFAKRLNADKFALAQIKLGSRRRRALGHAERPQGVWSAADCTLEPL